MDFRICLVPSVIHIRFMAKPPIAKPMELWVDIRVVPKVGHMHVLLLGIVSSANTEAEALVFVCHIARGNEQIASGNVD